LSKDVVPEFFATELAGPVENGTLEILRERQAIGFNLVGHLFVPLGIFLPIKTKALGGRATRLMTPPIRQQHAADVKKDCGQGHKALGSSKKSPRSGRRHKARGERSEPRDRWT
jgi:hypothetical protein